MERGNCCDEISTDFVMLRMRTRSLPDRKGWADRRAPIGVPLAVFGVQEDGLHRQRSCRLLERLPRAGGSLFREGDRRQIRLPNRGCEIPAQNGDQVVTVMLLLDDLKFLSRNSVSAR